MKLNFWLGCVSAFVLASSAFAELELKEKGDLRDSDKVVVGGTPAKVIYPNTAGRNIGDTIYCDQLIAHEEELTAGDIVYGYDWEDYIVALDVGEYGESRWFLKQYRDTIGGWDGYIITLVRGLFGKTFVRWKGRVNLRPDGTISTVSGKPRAWSEDGEGELGTHIRLKDCDSDPTLEDFWFYAGIAMSHGLPLNKTAVCDSVAEVVTKDFVEGLGIESGGGVDEEAVNALIDAKLETKLAPEAFKQVAGAAMNTIYDEALGVTWKATMINGSLYYTAIVNEDATAIK